MTLQVIGSGLGRTGTKSLQSALGMLGLGPCHHMVEVWAHPESMELWIQAADGAPVWDAIFADYRSAVDFPAAAYWKVLSGHYPQAKVIHTVRDRDNWYESTQATIFAPDGPVERAVNSDSPVGAFFRSFLPDLLPHLHDRAFLLDYFDRHDAEVRAQIPSGRLLVYEVGQGWGPLCEFLGVPVPAEPYPSENSRAEFAARLEASRAGPSGGPPR
jgi:hypothetical protein